MNWTKVLERKEIKEMKGYKAFSSDWTCRGFQYEVGKKYTYDGKIEICKSGFHFCKNPVDCWNYYEWSGTQKFAEIEAAEPIICDGDGKFVTGEITIVSEIPTEEILKLCNDGTGNTGVGNAGDFNTGNMNIGSMNTGMCNDGRHNTGRFNTGDWNTGRFNTGDWNTGRFNTGDRNTGRENTGNRNAGDGNTGDWNSGSYNTGDGNTGDWNSGSYSCGCFCEEKNPRIMLFDKPSGWTMQDWLDSDQREILSEAPGNFASKSREETLQDNQKWWDRLTDNEKDRVKELPNFDADKFCRIMGGIKI